MNEDLIITLESPTKRSQILEKEKFKNTKNIDFKNKNERSNIFLERSVRGQNERLSSLKDKIVCFVCVGDILKINIYEDVLKYGIIAIIMEEEDNELTKKLEHLYKNQVYHVKVDLTTRDDLVIDCIEKINYTLKNEIKNNPDEKAATDIKLDGVLTLWDDAVGLAARISQEMNLPGNPIDTIDICHNKHQTRLWMKQNGLTTPNSLLIRDIKDLDLCKNLKFPIILKPVYGAASIAVEKVINIDELEKIYVSCLQTLTNCYQHHELMGLTFDFENKINYNAIDDDTSHDSDSLFYIMAEEFLKGKEYDCDVLMADGEVLFANLCDDWEYKYPHFLELGSNCPTDCCSSTAQKIIDYAVKVAKLFKFQWGPLHVEVIDDIDYGPCLIECNPRMGGGPIRDNLLSVWNIDLATEAVMASIGMPINPPYSRTPLMSNATACLFAELSGKLDCNVQQVLKSVVEEEEYAGKVKVFFGKGEQGDIITGWSDGYPSELGRVDISIKDDIITAKKVVNEIREKFLNRLKEHIL